MVKPDWKNESGDYFQQHAQDNLLEIYPWLLQDCLDLFGELKNRRILEIGGGPGHMASVFLKYGVEDLVEIDLSIGMLKKSMVLNKDKSVSLIQSNVSNTPLKSGLFDLIFSRGSIFFWEDLNAAFSEISRLLNPSGMAILGGGYGLKTPEEVLHRMADKKSSGKKPKLDLDTLLNTAKRLGGTARILSKKGNGFWLVWQPHFQGEV